jgi:hypothetical protein
MKVQGLFFGIGICIVTMASAMGATGNCPSNREANGLRLMQFQDTLSALGHVCKSQDSGRVVSVYNQFLGRHRKLIVDGRRIAGEYFRRIGFSESRKEDYRTMIQNSSAAGSNGGTSGICEQIYSDASQIVGLNKGADVIQAISRSQFSRSIPVNGCNL